MVPSSSSSSLTRQQRPQPSHRLSHSLSVISARVLVFQNGASTIGGSVSGYRGRVGEMHGAAAATALWLVLRAAAASCKASGVLWKGLRSKAFKCWGTTPDQAVFSLHPVAFPPLAGVPRRS